MNHQKCLVLNADFTPIGIISWQKAMVWYYRSQQPDNHSIDIIEYHNDDAVITCRGSQEIPSVVKTHKYFKLFNNDVNFCRKNVFIRDDFRCQYCNTKLPIGKLTYDHVIPKSRWNSTKRATCWTNIVTACAKCNAKKANKTPSQANMTLIREPFVPKKSFKYLPLAYQLNTIVTELPVQWKTYIGDMIG